MDSEYPDDDEYELQYTEKYAEELELMNELGIFSDRNSMEMLSQLI